MRNRNTVLALVASLVIAGLFTLLARKPGAPAPAAGDDYDYAAGFESLDPASDAPLLRIDQVAGRSEAEVAAVLGPAESCETSLYSRRCRYAPGSAEIVYIDGRADWFTVWLPGDAPLDDAVLARIGRQPKPATRASDEERVWTGLAGLREVRAVGEPGRVEFLRIKVKS